MDADSTATISGKPSKPAAVREVLVVSPQLLLPSFTTASDEKGWSLLFPCCLGDIVEVHSCAKVKRLGEENTEWQA
jgi:hypothetical protein